MKKHTVFPFTLLPTIVEVDDEHLTITYREFPGLSQIQTIPLKNIVLLEVDNGLFFSQLRFTWGVPEKEEKIPYFHRKDALELKDFIEVKKEDLRE